MTLNAMPTNEVDKFAHFANAVANGVFSTEREVVKWFLTTQCHGPDWRQTLTSMHDFAQQGDAMAQVYMGLAHMNGKGAIPKNQKEALAWFEKSAAQHCAWGQFYVGFFHMVGRGPCSKDERLALSWFERAAQEQHVGAILAIGTFYKYGRAGLTKELRRALEYFHIAADAGDPEAQCQLGVFTEKGWGGVPKNCLAAAEWFLHSAQQGFAPAMYLLACDLLVRPGNNRKRAENEMEAKVWLERAAAEKYAAAEYSLGLLYEQGRCGCEKSHEAAFTWFLKSADHGDPLAQLKVGIYYFEGRTGVIVDYESARAWFEKCFSNKNAVGDPEVPHVCYYLAVFYSFLENNVPLAMQMYELGARLGDADCTYLVGECCTTTSSCRDWRKAAIYLRRFIDMPKGNCRFSAFTAQKKLEIVVSHLIGQMSSPTAILPWCIRVNFCISVIETRALAMRALLHRLLVRAVVITRALKLQSASPLHQRGVCAEVFVAHILARVCAYYDEDANVTIVPPLSALRRAYQLGMDRAALCSTLFSRSVWHSFLLDDEAAMIATACLCTAPRCVAFGTIHEMCEASYCVRRLVPAELSVTDKDRRVRFVRKAIQQTRAQQTL